MSRFAGPSCKSILYCNPEQPPPTTATRNTPLGRPCLVSNVPTFFAALSVSLIKRSSPVRKVGVAAGLAAMLLIIFCQLPTYGRRRCGSILSKRCTVAAEVRGLHIFTADQHGSLLTPAATVR